MEEEQISEEQIGELKRFKIEKKTSYEQDINVASRHITCSIVALGILTLGKIIINSISPVAEDGFDMAKLISSINIVGFNAGSLSLLVKSVANKIALKVNLEQINNELEMLELEEKRGKSK